MTVTKEPMPTSSPVSAASAMGDAHGDNAAYERSAPVSSSSFLHFLRLFAKGLLPLLIIVGAGGFAFFLVSTKPEVAKRQKRELSFAVEVKQVIPEARQPQIVLYGTVSAGRKVDLRALVGGEVIWVNPALAEGELLVEGESLVRIDPFDYQGGVREAQANLNEARAKISETEALIASDEATVARLSEQLALAKQDLARAERLKKSGTLAIQTLENRQLVASQRQQALEAKQNNLSVLKARIEQQRANVERLSWRFDQAKRNLADTTLHAPFKGVVQSKSVDLGRNVSGNDTLLSMYDPDQMDVGFTLSDAQYGRLIAQNESLLDREIDVIWKLGDQERSHKARISRITPEVKAAEGGVQVFARLLPGVQLRSGTFVELLVPDQSYENVIEIPQASIYSDSILYVYKEGRMDPRKAVVRAYLGDTVLVDASQLEEGDYIITTRIAEAGQGLKVIAPALNKTGDKGGKQRGPGKSKGQGGEGKKANQAGAQS